MFMFLSIGSSADTKNKWFVVKSGQHSKYGLLLLTAVCIEPDALPDDEVHDEVGEQEK